MPNRPTAPDKPADLRARAASRLTGRDGAPRAPLDASNALAVLHALASSPDTAADALALLHELQVHQVELDLQAEELRESHAELESALRLQADLYDLQPVGCFTVDRACVVQQLNRAGAAMLGVDRAHGCDQRLDSFLAPGSDSALRQLILTMAADTACPVRAMQLVPGSGAGRPVGVHVRSDPDGKHFLVVLAELDPSHDTDSPPPASR